MDPEQQKEIASKVVKRLKKKELPMNLVVKKP